jgi:hypothetical protein
MQALLIFFYFSSFTLFFWCGFYLSFFTPLSLLLLIVFLQGGSFFHILPFSFSFVAIRKCHKNAIKNQKNASCMCTLPGTLRLEQWTLSSNLCVGEQHENEGHHVTDYGY